MGLLGRTRGRRHKWSIRVKKPKKSFECWVKDKTRVPLGAQNDIITALQVPNHNFIKDEYVVDMTGHETHYWQGTESNTQTPLPPSSLQDQRTLNSRKVGREDEGVSSSRPELVALTECLEDHDDDVSLLNLTDREAILQGIHRWIGCGAKLNLSKSPRRS